MKKILILTAAFGDGHNTAARNIRDALEHICDDVKVEVLDLFDASYGAFNTLAKKAYLGMVQYAPRLWGSVYALMENPVVERNLGGFTRLANALEDIVHETQPDGVVSTYPVYGHVIRELYRDHAERPFRFITVITDSISVNSAWYRASLWTEWRRNLERISKPDASLRIAELILGECDRTDRKKIALFEPGVRPSLQRAPSAGRAEPKMLLCDFHIHTNYSDGKLTVPELIDFYGHHGFDCICITDHLADPRRLIGKLSELASFSLGQNQVGEYFEVIEQERRRAWRKYGMLVMTGLEFNKDGYTRKSSAHLLGIDLKASIDPSLDLAQIIKHIHSQDGLAVASHPHIMKSEWGKNTLYLWENQDKFAPLIDAWEIANRNTIFTPIGLKNLSFIANSDFHKPKHIYSWKTLLHCPKEAEAIKDCIRGNHDVAITLYRDLGVTPAARRGFLTPRLADPLAHSSPRVPQIVNS